jgi:hypothetical protein
MNDPVVAATELIESLAPVRASVPIRTPLRTDESRWFVRAVEERVVRFERCPPSCFRRKRSGVPGPDHFVTPSGKPRHLFAKPEGPEPWLSREYVPHIAAFSFAILEHGYDRDRCSFSRYRKFERDVMVKKAGTSYETDAEFYDGAGRIHLQIEAKASERQTAALAESIEAHGLLADLPSSAAKEIEYVLDLFPRYLWVVGPGSLDPPRFIYSVERRGPLNAAFTLRFRGYLIRQAAMSLRRSASSAWLLAPITTTRPIAGSQLPSNRSGTRSTRPLAVPSPIGVIASWARSRAGTPIPSISQPRVSRNGFNSAKRSPSSARDSNSPQLCDAVEPTLLAITLRRTGGRNNKVMCEPLCQLSHARRCHARSCSSSSVGSSSRARAAIRRSCSRCSSGVMSSSDPTRSPHTP